MQPKHNKQLVSLTKQLQKEMTGEERQQRYAFLRSCPVRFFKEISVESVRISLLR